MVALMGGLTVLAGMRASVAIITTTAAVIAQGLLRRLAKPEDDATVLVVRTPPASVSGLPAAAS